MSLIKLIEAGRTGQDETTLIDIAVQLYVKIRSTECQVILNEWPMLCVVNDLILLL